MDKDELSRIADLMTQDDRPGASLLTPEVRSGSSFTYTPVVGSASMPAFLLVWFYTVDDVTAFVAAVQNAERGTITTPAGVEYRGTYSVSISSPAPDLEFRTYWGLDDLGKLQALNNFLPTAGPAFRDMLKLIKRRTVMHSELMGLTGTSTPL
jgi:hypothetical protein